MPQDTPEELNTSPVDESMLEVLLQNQDENAKSNDSLLENILQQMDNTNPEPLLEAGIKQSIDNTDKIVSAIKDKPETQKVEIVTNPNELAQHFFSMLRGEKGEKGDKGDSIRGEQGLKGEKGDSIRGEQGVKGDKGDQGEIGIPGMDGLDGKTGKPGKDGKDGKDGSPDKPSDIVNKLESLKGDNRLDFSAIKGLEKLLKTSNNLQQEHVFMGGGGVWGQITGNILAQTDLINYIASHGGGGGPVTGLTGNPTEIVYIDNSGNGTGDNLFTRDSATGNTNILALFTGDLAGGFSIDTAAQNTNAGVLDLVTNESALFEGLVSGGGMRTQMTYRKPSTNVLGQFVLQESGNSLIWDADTTDGVQDGFIQGNNLNGVGIKGNALAHSNTSTFESASFFAGDTTAVGGNPYEASMAYVLPGGINGAFAYTVNDDGLKAEYHDIAGNIKSQILQEAIGNTISWNADTTDTIITKLEQNEDILGLGGLAGSALTWEDTTTQVQAFIGAVDASAVGLFPGSVLMVTNNNATGASANIVTNYDNVLNVATAVANVANGNFDSGFAFDDGRMIVRYRNSTTGFESAFESDISGALTRYKLNTASDEYSTQLGNGVFQFFNSTTADQYMSLGGTTGIFQFGDISGASNDTKFIINDSAQIITNHVDGVFTVEDGAASSIAYIDAANRQSIFGNVSSAGGIKMYIDETVGINVQAPGAILNLGANTFGNETNLQVDDTTGIIKALIPTGGDFEVVNAAGNVAFTVIPDNFYTKIGDADNVGNSTSLIVDDATQSIAVSKPFTLKGYTVATLPTGVVGNTAYVTDALTPVFGATAVGGGAVTVPVFFDGATWIVG